MDLRLQVKHKHIQVTKRIQHVISKLEILTYAKQVFEVKKQTLQVS